MGTSITKSYKDLIVWQKGVTLSVLVYELTEKFPNEERYALTSQMRRAGVSIPSNIAEGRCRSTKKDFCNFLHIALGSAAELETQIEIAKRITKTSGLPYSEVGDLLTEVMKMLNSLISKLEATS
ncbi:MAG: four helix bundle protein [Candidatus Taylorbacteria bacterium]|nr:four helix bundle protein [Candidatus Taylorbacteria bacterium]